MTNDPNDRFMISDLSSKLSAYINGEDVNFVTYDDEPVYTQTESEAYYRKNKNIEDALASEIKPAKNPRRTPGDTMFSDLDHALDDVHKEQSGKKQPGDSQLRQEQYRQEQLRQQARQEQLRQEQLRQEQLRQEQLRQEQLRQEQIRQEHLRQEQLRQEQIRQSRQTKVIDFSYGLYNFKLDQPFTSVHSNHTTRYAPKAVVPKPTPAVTIPSQPASAVHVPSQSAPAVHEEPVSREPLAGAFTSPDRTSTQTRSYDLPEGEHHTSGYAHTFDDPEAYAHDHHKKEGSRLGVIIVLLLALVVGAALFILIRRYSSTLTGLMTGSPAASTSTESTVESTDTEKEDEEAQPEEAEPDASQADTQAAEETDAGTDTESASEIETTESGTETVVGTEEEAEEALTGDPSDISYIASVNEKAAADAIAELDSKNPRLYLSSYGLKISAGTSFNALSYVENIEDDADDRNRLYSDISVNGLDTFDANTPGTYELVYFCYDSAGNRSNRATLTVIVE